MAEQCGPKKVRGQLSNPLYLGTPPLTQQQQQARQQQRQPKGFETAWKALRTPFYTPFYTPTTRVPLRAEDGVHPVGVGRPPAGPHLLFRTRTTPRRSRHTTSLLGASAAVRAGRTEMNREAGEFGHRTRFRMLPPTPPATYVADLARSLGLRRA